MQGRSPALDATPDPGPLGAGFQHVLAETVEAAHEAGAMPGGGVVTSRDAVTLMIASVTPTDDALLG